MDDFSRDPSAEAEHLESRRRGFRSILACVAFVLLFFALRPAKVRAAWVGFETLVQLGSHPLPASPARLSDHLTQELTGMVPQEQAELLLQESINHYDGAIELLGERLAAWQGRLKFTTELSGELDTAMNSNDLRVRAAGIELYLATNNLAKSEQAANGLMLRIEDDPGGRPWALWMLGALGNRGVEPRRAFDMIFKYTQDPDQGTRYWAVEGLALLGTDETIRPLLDVFHNDPSPRVRERAACSLAQSGMLTKEQRLRAVPGLLSDMDDPAFDSTTRPWVFQALRDITGASLGEDAVAWRTWWAQHSEFAQARP
jgi:hypothetical protein